ncbi:expressed unknown protein [Seminavis robusta]|uniref:Uncharacterized protein n=1 Tax=Seminavis robusta TaxID=568900 RepID=A0A9N8HQK2_9STRA|nr:expressed unknown protein [Seminavis robusta]|eukprot:Sro1174_g249030.1 n/a (203) ;mRNA; r:18999-19607
MMHKRRQDGGSTLPLKKRIRRKQGVSFGRNTCRLYNANMSEKERSRVWYKAEDYKRIQSDIQADLRGSVAMHRSKHQYMDRKPSEDLCVRGLESLLSGPMHSKRHRRRYFVDYFLHTHRNMKVTNSDELRSLALSLSGHDQSRAQYIADYDAYEAYKVHNESRLFQPHRDVMAMEAFEEFDNVPKATIGARRGERIIVPPIA